MTNRNGIRGLWIQFSYLRGNWDSEKKNLCLKSESMLRADMVPEPMTSNSIELWLVITGKCRSKDWDSTFGNQIY